MSLLWSKGTIGFNFTGIYPGVEEGGRGTKREGEASEEGRERETGNRKGEKEEINIRFQKIQHRIQDKNNELHRQVDR